MIRLLRGSGTAIALGAVLVIVSVSLGQGIGLLYLSGLFLLVLGILGQYLNNRLQRPRQEREPLLVQVPFWGRWRGLNSPSTKIPSHTHSLAQTYALDSTYEPRDAAPRTLDWLWPPMRTPESFPSFGQPIFAPLDAVVVEAHDSSRDHLSRLSPIGLAYLIAEGFIRSLGSPRHLLGNYVILRAKVSPQISETGASPLRAEEEKHEEVFVVLAHLRRNSLKVSPGERVVIGQQIAECGNSGNSSDPHLHIQLMDGPDITTARGVPFEWNYSREDGKLQRGLPSTGEIFIAG